MKQLIVIDRLRGLNSKVDNARGGAFDLGTLKYGGVCFYDPAFYNPNSRACTPWSDSSIINKDFCVATGSKNWYEDGARIFHVEVKDLIVTRAIGSEGIKANISAQIPTITDTECELVLKLYNRKYVNTDSQDTVTVSQYSKTGTFDVDAIKKELQNKYYNMNESDSNWNTTFDNGRPICENLFDKAGLKITSSGDTINIEGRVAGDQWTCSVIVYGSVGKILYKELYKPEVEDGIGTPEYMFNLYNECLGNRGFTDVDAAGKTLYPGILKSVDDVKKEWFSNDKTITYSIITLRFRNYRTSSKTRDEVVWQTIHIAYPTDKAASQGGNWQWVDTLFTNYMK